jgi:hypothetical protein
VVDEPVYLRPPDYRYCLRSDPSHPLFTGLASDGRQALAVAGAVLEFDRDGLLTAERDGATPDALPAGFAEGPIGLRRFWLPSRWLGISDIPHGLLGLPADPDKFTDADRAFVLSSDWFAHGNFALRCGKGELFISRDGECLLHSA